jgi:hypothetical protein
MLRPDGVAVEEQDKVDEFGPNSSTRHNESASSRVKAAAVDSLRVEMHSAQRGLEEMADQADSPEWFQALPG